MQKSKFRTFELFLGCGNNRLTICHEVRAFCHICHDTVVFLLSSSVVTSLKAAVLLELICQEYGCAKTMPPYLATWRG